MCEGCRFRCRCERTHYQTDTLFLSEWYFARLSFESFNENLTRLLPQQKALISKVLTPAGFKWPLMALEACSGSGSLKLGEALYESLLHLSPLLLLPVEAHTYCSHNSTALRRHNHEFLRSWEKLLQSDWHIFPHKIFTRNLPFHRVTTQNLRVKFV